MRRPWLLAMQAVECHEWREGNILGERRPGSTAHSLHRAYHHDRRAPVTLMFVSRPLAHFPAASVRAKKLAAAFKRGRSFSEKIESEAHGVTCLTTKWLDVRSSDGLRSACTTLRPVAELPTAAI